MTTETNRLPLMIGALDGAIVIAVLSTISAAISGWQFHPAYVLVTTPFGIVAAWRGSRFVRRLLEGKARPFRGPIEGFFIAFGATTIWLVSRILAGHVAGGDPQGWGSSFWGLLVAYTLFYSLIAGAAGAIIGAILETIDVLVVELRATQDRPERPGSATSI